MNKKLKIIAILPAYKAEETLIPFLNKFPRKLFNEIIFVDDCSPDNTYQIAKQQKGIKVYQTPHNLGYGGNIKMCLSIALDYGADVIIELHPDGEYDTDGVTPALQEIKRGSYMVLGNRFSNFNDVKKSGWFLWKYPLSVFLTFIDNFILGININDLHQGFRVYTKKMLQNINFRATSNDYDFSFEVISQVAFNKFPISQVKVSTFYTGKKRGASIKASFLYSICTFKVLTLFILAHLGFPIKLFNQPDKIAKCPKCKLSYLVYLQSSTSNDDTFLCKICNENFTISRLNEY